MASIPSSHPELSRGRASSISAQAPIGVPRPHNSLHTLVTPHNPQARDPFYGHEKLARFITHLLACPKNIPTTGVTAIHEKLPYLIVYPLHRTKLHSAITYAALVLQRLKARFPTARGSSGHLLFISAFMIASKVICNDAHLNKSWTIVAQGIFSLRQANQMEREMCGYLDWTITINNEILAKFENTLRQDFRVEQDQYPSHPNSMVSRRVVRASASPSNIPEPQPNSPTTPVPGFTTQSDIPSKPHYPQVHSPSTISSSSSPSSWDVSVMPDTSPFTYSNSASHASSGSLYTPINDAMSNLHIEGVDPSPQFRIGPEKVVVKG